jgi:hypothetical protein
MNELEILKTATPIIMPFIAPVIDTWLKPKLSKMVAKSNANKQLDEHGFANKFEEYLKRSFDRNSRVTILALGNQPSELERIYVPLTIEIDEKPNLFMQGAQEHVIDKYDTGFIPLLRRVAITDSAGMGKSTVLRYLFLSVIKQNAAIPVLIELRKLSSSRSILDHIIQELNPIDEEFDKEFILQVIKKGDFVFFLDGLDEIVERERKEVIGDIQRFVSKASNNYFVLTSRPESALASFPDFVQSSIKPLTKNDAYTLLSKYDVNGKIAPDIIKKLRNPESSHFDEFLRNPFLVSLLYKSYEYKATIPLKKHIFYRQVYDALFESHDLSKGESYSREKHSKLDIDDFHRVLRVLGLLTVREGKVEYDKDDILKKLDIAKDFCPGISFRQNDFLKDLLSTVPIFNADGNYYRWSHKSLQEYFAAQYICTDAKASQVSILQEMYRSDRVHRYLNVLDLCLDMDYKIFRNTVILEMLKKYKEYFETSYLGIDRSKVDESQITARKQVSFGFKLAIISGYQFERVTVYHRRVTKLLGRLGIAVGAKVHNPYANSDRPFELRAAHLRFVMGNNFDGMLIQMLRKKMNLLLSKRDEIHSRKPDRELDYWELFEDEDQNEEVIVSDDPDMKHNQPEYFSATTRLIYKMSHYAIDTKKVDKFLEEIVSDMKKEEKCERIFDTF